MTDDVVETRLNGAQLGELLAKVEREAEVAGIRTSDGDTEDLPAVAAALAAGSISRAQVRYAFEGEPWIDTVIADGGEFRLVRVRVPQP